MEDKKAVDQVGKVDRLTAMNGIKLGCHPAPPLPRVVQTRDSTFPQSLKKVEGEHLCANM